MTRDKARTAAAVALGVIVTLLAVLNLDEVEVNWILGTWQTPLIVVIVLSVAAGLAIGFALAHRRVKGRRPAPSVPPRRT